MHEITYEKALDFFGRSIDAMVVADPNADSYKSLVRRGIFQELIEDNGNYKDLVQKLWFHFNGSDKEITEEYQVFIPNLGKFVGKYSKRLKIVINGTTHFVQMMIEPVDDTEQYLILLDELNEKESEEDVETKQKVNTIQNIYLFSMCIDLVHDTTSSLSLTEVSEETMNSQISYTAWRQTIVNMIWKNDQKLFLERSDPEYLRTHFEPGHIESFDCQMQNLEGFFIWVKLIFSRMDTTNENDYRFVYMVQNIHDTTVEMKAALKHYEELASRDSLTKIFNHGRIETEICNAIEQCHKNGTNAFLLIIDIDYFKKVNDSHGHTAGDATLVKFAGIIREILSKRNASFGRWGGEEFAAVIYGLKNEELRAVAEEIRCTVENTDFGEIGKITCSVGGTELMEDDVFESWFNRADKAVYTSKENGRNLVTIE
ncbi:MAG: GGDEF domain-containing protein [Ruminococcus sp.]|nr:GGDEF domain-containing protein [Ruminococcus sp.]